MPKKLLIWIRCLLLPHDWTCAAEQGIQPTQAQLDTMKSGSLSGFYDYAKMYCKHCGVESKISKEWRERNA